MASRNDGLTEILMQLAANSAQLVEKAKAAGFFREKPIEATAAPAAAPEPDPGKAALQEIIVAQAMKIHQLEAEVARLKSSPERGGGPA